MPPALHEPLGEAALGLRARFIGTDGKSVFIEADTDGAVRGLRPDFRRMLTIGVRSVIVTARADADGIDFVSRFFAPGVGIDEDPVTGSAHCSLATYWARKLGRSSMIGFQASARGGRVEVRVENNRVHIGGHAVTVLRGELTV